MNNDRGFDDRLDAAIDRAVRDIMSAEPRAGFRGRVLDRLDAGGRSRAGLFAWRPAMIGAAAIALVVLAFVVAPREPYTPGTPPAQTAAQAPRVETPAAPPVVTPPQAVAEAPAGPPGSSASRVPPARTRLSRERIAMPPVADVFGPSSDRVSATTVDRAAAPDALAGSDLAIPMLGAPAPIVVAPLVVPPIQVAPIEIRRIDVRPPK
jgi:hypothetical protein